MSYEEVIARLTAEGLDPAQIRARTDLDVSFIRRVQDSPDFEPVLRSINPKAADLWAEAQSEERARRRVKQQAREDAPKHYEMLKRLAESGDLKDSERAGILRDLIKFSGAVDEHIDEEIVILNAPQLALFEETFGELFND